jgi:hypothetical protein
MKTKKKFFLKAAGISLAKAAGISLAFVLAFAMAFAACDNDGSSGSKGGTIAPDGPTDMGDGPTAATWADAKLYLESVLGAGLDVIYIRDLAQVTVGETHIPDGKTLVITGEVEGVAPSSSVSILPDVPRLIIPNRAKLIVDAGGTLVLGGPKAELYAGIVDIQGGGSLYVKEDGILSINRSSRVSVNGENPDRPDYSDGYIALNLESRSILALLGTFVDGDDIIAKSSAERRLIDILTTTAPVAVGAVKVYNSIPKAGVTIEPSSTLGGALVDGKNKATVDSPVKVADTAAEVTTLIEDVLIRPSAQWFTQRIIYSGDGALGDSAKKLNIPLNTRVIVERNVTQNKSVTIQKHPTSSITGSYGTLEIASGASIRVTKGTDGFTPSSLDLVATGKLTVANGGLLAVADGCFLDLSAITTDLAPDPANPGDPYPVTLYGEIAVAAGGTFNMPQIDASNQTMPQVSWGTGTGRVTLASGSMARTSLDSTPVYYIGPAAATNGPEYSWTAGDTASSTVTLVGTDMTLNGNLTVTKATSIAKKAIIESGVLTVAADLTVRTGAKLTVATGAKVVVEKDKVLDLSALDTATTDNGAVTLSGNGTGNGTIEVKEGTIKLPKLAANNTIAAITYEGTGAAIRLYHSSTALLDESGGAGNPDVPASYVDDSGSPWQWAPASTEVTSYVDLKANGEFAVTGNLISQGETSGPNMNKNIIYTTLTVNGSKSTLTVPSGKTLALDKAGKLTVNAGSKILLATGGTGGILDLEALDNAATNSGTLVTINGTVEVEEGATLKYPKRASEDSHLRYGGDGKAIIKYNGKATTTDATPLKVGDGATDDFKFVQSLGSDNDGAYVQFGQNAVRFGGKITLANNGGTIPQSDTWSISDDATLTIEDAEKLTVSGTLRVDNGGTLAFEDTDSELILKVGQTQNGKLILGSGESGGLNTEITPKETGKFGPDAKITLAGTDKANLDLVIDIVLGPETNIPGESTVPSGNNSATIKTGTPSSNTAIITPSVITSREAVVTVLPATTGSNPIPDAKGFGAGVLIGANKIEVGADGATRSYRS